jgi:hypothetical protein
VVAGVDERDKIVTDLQTLKARPICDAALP